MHITLQQESQEDNCFMSLIQVFVLMMIKILPSWAVLICRNLTYIKGGSTILIFQSNRKFSSASICLVISSRSWILQRHQVGMSHTSHDKHKTSFTSHSNLIIARHHLTFFLVFIMSISNFNFQFSPSSSQFATKLFPGWGHYHWTTGCKYILRGSGAKPLIAIRPHVEAQSRAICLYAAHEDLSLFFFSPHTVPINEQIAPFYKITQF